MLGMKRICKCNRNVQWAGGGAAAGITCCVYSSLVRAMCPAPGPHLEPVLCGRQPVWGDLLPCHTSPWVSSACSSVNIEMAALAARCRALARVGNSRSTVHICLLLSHDKQGKNMENKNRFLWRYQKSTSMKTCYHELMTYWGMFHEFLFSVPLPARLMTMSLATGSSGGGGDMVQQSTAQATSHQL